MRRRPFAPLVDAARREIRLAPEWLLVSIFNTLTFGFMIVMILAVTP